ncbi:EF-hand domain-containing protein 1-like [Atheta coriaria]|uniref:EF-hand domain-containing protein 1-like n=1 Tax=Dalotia coriaria TaxID=877792 RepID=UPI0031F477B2
MAGLPKLPGFTFKDPTKQNFNLAQTFNIVNGYQLPRTNYSGIGKSELDVNSVNYFNKLDAIHYDPTLTYGRCRSMPPKTFMPHYALYDQKCLTFKAFFKQAVFESPWEFFRVRQVNIIYFLEDDTLTVIEPKTENSGYDQGRLVTRGKIQKYEDGTLFHWKDLNIGRDICIYGIVYHTVDCDNFTREYLASQGVELAQREEMPPDPYTQDRKFKTAVTTHKTHQNDDKVRRFLEYDGKILKFKALWDDESEYGEKRPYEVYYFLCDDTVSVKEVMEDMEGRDPFPQLLRRTKLPKIWTQRPDDFPSIYLELSDNEVTEFYQPKDFRVGETIFILGRRMLLYDCDKFTRNYFAKVLNYTQEPAIDVSMPKKPKVVHKMPPHVMGIGSLEDSLESTLRIIPKVPKKDVIRQVTNANKYLRYIIKFDLVHPEDEIRKFILKYNLGDGTCSIYEPPIINSGILGGKYLRATMLIKPGSDPVNPEYYTPVDFYIGAVISVFQQRFIVIGADLYTYRYMQKNPEKFPCEVVENLRNYMFNQGLLDNDLQEQVEQEHEVAKKEKRDAIGREIEIRATEMEKCIEAANAGNPDEVIQQAKMDKIVEEYEESIKRRTPVPPHGIKPVNLDCAYNVHVGDIKPVECVDIGDSEFTPKHIDTKEEALKKHYDAILAKHKEVCATTKLPECETPTPIGLDRPPMKKEKVKAEPLMVQPYELPYGACRIKSVRFAEGPERCERDAKDLCDHKNKQIACNCTNYYQKCT